MVLQLSSNSRSGIVSRVSESNISRLLCVAMIPQPSCWSTPQTSDRIRAGDTWRGSGSWITDNSLRRYTRVC